MAKAMGEVGVLTEQDVKRYVQSGQLLRATEDKLLKMIKGTPIQATQDEIIQIVGVMKDAYDSNIRPKQKEYVERLFRNYPQLGSEGQAAYRLGFVDTPEGWGPSKEGPDERKTIKGINYIRKGTKWYKE